MGTGGGPVGRLLHDGIFDSRNLRGCHGNHQRGKRSTSFKSVLGLCLFIPVQHELLLYCGHADLDLVVIFTGIWWIALSPWSVSVTMTGLVDNGAEGCKNMLTKPSYLKKLGEVGGGEILRIQIVMCNKQWVTGNNVLFLPGGGAGWNGKGCCVRDAQTEDWGVCCQTSGSDRHCPRYIYNVRFVRLHCKKPVSINRPDITVLVDCA